MRVRKAYHICKATEVTDFHPLTVMDLKEGIMMEWGKISKFPSRDHLIATQIPCSLVSGWKQRCAMKLYFNLHNLLDASHSNVSYVSIYIIPHWTRRFFKNPLVRSFSAVLLRAWIHRRQGNVFSWKWGFIGVAGAQAWPNGRERATKAGTNREKLEDVVVACSRCAFQRVERFLLVLEVLGGCMIGSNFVDDWQRIPNRTL